LVILDNKVSSCGKSSMGCISDGYIPPLLRQNSFTDGLVQVYHLVRGHNQTRHSVKDHKVI